MTTLFLFHTPIEFWNSPVYVKQAQLPATRRASTNRPNPQVHDDGLFCSERMARGHCMRSFANQ